MKKLISLSLALLLVLSLCACGQKAPELEYTLEEEFEFKVDVAVAGYCRANYADVKSTILSLGTIDIIDDTYIGKGKVRVIDDYGDAYVGKVTAVFKYDGESFTEVSLDIERPAKE